ncbi:PHD finger protein 7-like isoform X2 [Watersipora subatra]|uniref:PHD finger protein 7-like isoform X2 n=1 Tax=Watersipora subatra TaxID=2589382 RepID=UPI00355C8CB9
MKRDMGQWRMVMDSSHTTSVCFSLVALRNAEMTAKKCCYCKKNNASIGCSKQRCRRSYHYGCGKDRGSMYLYYDDFRSYCAKHRLQQDDLTEEEKQKEGDTTDNSCFICYEPLTSAVSNSTILSPCCTRAWYHRPCIEDMAYSAGLHFFKCPLCNNVDEWQAEMLRAGIYIPDRDASWELEPNAYNSLLETYIECEAEDCLCAQGRREDQDDGPWELILCDACGSQGCHRACGKLKKRDTEWLCKLCSTTVSNPLPENPPSKKPASNATRAGRSRGIQEVTNVMQ